MNTIPNFVNGKTVLSQSEEFKPVWNPATGIQIASVPLSTRQEVDEAIRSACDAFEIWSKVTPVKRARVMFKFKQLLEDNFEELARLITREHGKVLSDARGELMRGIEVVEFACGIPHLLKGEHSLNVGVDVDSYSYMQPLGVCAGISPFNFPAMVPMWMYPIALSCGNTFILKPSEKVPSFAVRVAELLIESGLPDGAFNVVNGGKDVVDFILQDPSIEAVSFVGSTEIAEHVYTVGSRYGKRVQALGGAKNHLVAMPDADVQSVVDALMGAAYGSAGERCMAISVAVCVGDAIADALVQELHSFIQKLVVGPGDSSDISVSMGPLIDAVHAERVKRFIDIGVAEGATIVADGRGLIVDGSENGFFVGPTLFDHVASEMQIYQEEIFGPVLCVVRVSSYEEAVALINNHQYGNGATIFTSSGRIARRFSVDIKAGMVGINVSIPVPMAFHSFGGWKRSVFGALNMYGIDGVRFYTQMKTITSKWPLHGGSELSFSMPVME